MAEEGTNTEGEEGQVNEGEGQTPAIKEGEIVDGEGNNITQEQIDDQGDLKKEETKKDEERPEWLDEKFKSPEDLAKSYKELEKTLREKGKVAPDKYELSDDVKNLPLDKEALDDIFKDAKEMNWTNEQLNQGLELASKYGLFDGPDFEEEMKSLGSEKDELIGLADKMTQKHIKDEELRNEFVGLFTTAKGLRALNAYTKSILNGGNIPQGKAESKTDMKSMQDELSNLLSDPNIRTDMNKKRKAEELATAIAKEKSM